MDKQSLEATGGVSTCVSTAYRRSVAITIDRHALRSNLSLARRLSGSSLQFATIKADAYGHGAVEVAKTLSQSGGVGEDNLVPGGYADGFAVVTINEALELRESGIDEPILVLQGPQSSAEFELVAKLSLWPVIHDQIQLAWLQKYRSKVPLSAWLKIDTGMGRLGFLPQDAKRILQDENLVTWKGLMTHFACADEVNNPFTEHQLTVFNQVAEGRSLLRSLANSAAILAWPNTVADWARPGIMLYGCNPLDTQLPENVKLLPAMTVSAPVISVKQLPQGASIGYARQWICPTPMRVGYVALGYRDGLPRVLDSTATVVVKGIACAVLGRVSMDSIAVDLSSVEGATVGLAAEFWGAEASVDNLLQLPAPLVTNY